MIRNKNTTLVLAKPRADVRRLSLWGETIRFLTDQNLVLVVAAGSNDPTHIETTKGGASCVNQ